MPAGPFAKTDRLGHDSRKRFFSAGALPIGLVFHGHVPLASHVSTRQALNLSHHRFSFRLLRCARRPDAIVPFCGSRATSLTLGRPPEHRLSPIPLCAVLPAGSIDVFRSRVPSIIRPVRSLGVEWPRFLRLVADVFLFFFFFVFFFYPPAQVAPVFLISTRVFGMPMPPCYFHSPRLMVRMFRSARIRFPTFPLPIFSCTFSKRRCVDVLDP